MTWNLADLATLVDGHLIGDPGTVCRGANPPAQAVDGEITLLDDPTRIHWIEQSSAVAVVVGEPMSSLDRPQLVVANPHQAFATIVSQFRPPISSIVNGEAATISETASIHPSAVIGFGVTIGERVQIGPGVVIMPRCRIGNDCQIHANVTLYEYTHLAQRVNIHSGSVIGAHGFGYRQENGKHVPTFQLGYVAIESDVDIGAGVTIDRGTYGATRIGEGTKIDNQVQVAHNCQIGKHNLLCSQVGIAGSCSTGDHVILAGQVGLKDHVHLGENAIVGAQAGVMDDLPGNQVYLGSPCMPQREMMQVWAVERKLPEFRRDLKQIRRDLDQVRNEQTQASNQTTGQSPEQAA